MWWLWNYVWMSECSYCESVYSIHLKYTYGQFNSTQAIIVHSLLNKLNINLCEIIGQALGIIPIRVILVLESKYWKVVLDQLVKQTWWLMGTGDDRWSRQIFTRGKGGLCYQFFFWQQKQGTQICKYVIHISYFPFRISIDCSGKRGRSHIWSCWDVDTHSLLDLICKDHRIIVRRTCIGGGKSYLISEIVVLVFAI